MWQWNEKDICPKISHWMKIKEKKNKKTVCTFPQIRVKFAFRWAKKYAHEYENEFLFIFLIVWTKNGRRLYLILAQILRSRCRFFVSLSRLHVPTYHNAFIRFVPSPWWTIGIVRFRTVRMCRLRIISLCSPSKQTICYTNICTIFCHLLFTLILPDLWSFSLGYIGGPAHGIFVQFRSAVLEKSFIFWHLANFHVQTSTKAKRIWNRIFCGSFDWDQNELHTPYFATWNW